jgi:hypothetical protein
MAMRDIIKKSIEEGGATKASLLKLTGTTEKGLASQFTYLRMMGNCPMKQEDGTWKIVSTEEWEAHRASGGGVSGKILTPAERVDKAQKRSNRAASAFDNAQTKHDADKDDRLNQLKLIKAEAEFEIAEIELGKAEAALAAAPPEEDVEVPDEETEDSGFEEAEGEISEENLAELETDPKELQ